MVNKLLDLFLGSTAPTEEATTEPPARPPVKKKLLSSRPPPVLEESQDGLKLALEKVKESGKRRILCYQGATEIFDDEELHRAFVEIDVEVPDEDL